MMKIIITAWSILNENPCKNSTLRSGRGGSSSITIYRYINIWKIFSTLLQKLFVRMIWTFVISLNSHWYTPNAIYCRYMYVYIYIIFLSFQFNRKKEQIKQHNYYHHHYFSMLNDSQQIYIYIDQMKLSIPPPPSLIT